MEARTAPATRTDGQAATTRRRPPDAQRAQAGLPPGPRAPALIQTRRYIRDPFGFLERCQEKYGDAATVNLLGFGRTIWVTDPELVKELFNRGEDLPMSPAGNLVRPIFGMSSVTGLDGAAHLQRRKMLLPHFHGDSLSTYEAGFSAACDRMIRRWGNGAEIELQPEMSRVMMDVLFEMLLGVRDPAKTAELKEASEGLMAMMALCAVGDWVRHDLGPISPWGVFKRRRRALDRLLYQEIAEHRNASAGGSDGDDVLSMLIGARFDDGSSLTDEEIRNELVTLIVAGSETTATALAWAFDLVLHRPGAVPRIVSEAAIGESGYTDAAVQETLRLRPPVIAAGRVAIKDADFGPWRVPEGVRLWAPMSLIQRDPEIYDRPNEFRPERFLEGKPPSYMWIPFGGGVRRCLGAPFAMLALRIVLQTVLSRTKLSPLNESTEHTRANGAIVVPDNGVRVRNEGARGAGANRGSHPLDELLASTAPAGDSGLDRRGIPVDGA